MARSAYLALIGLLAMPCALAEGGDALTGIWVTASGEAVVYLEPDAGEIRVTLRAVAPPLLNEGAAPVPKDVNNPKLNLRDRPLAGIDPGRLRSSENGRWRGRLYDPQSGNTYRVSVEALHPDVLEVRGYVAFPPFGRIMHWVSLRRHRERLMALWAEGVP